MFCFAYDILQVIFLVGSIFYTKRFLEEVTSKYAVVLQNFDFFLDVQRVKV